ncbi:hypothetical protein [Streptomyces sp. bgisy095]|uniref:hypothetical protein n=1 Tax=unclassified Streptomyces TaxID=2593676 RepID=UPI003D73E2D6
MPPRAPSPTGRRRPLWAAVFALLATLLGSLVTAAPPAAADPVLCDQCVDVRERGLAVTVAEHDNLTNNVPAGSPSPAPS